MQSISFLHAQASGLEDDLVGVGYGLCLDIAHARADHLGYDRLDLAVYALQRHGLVEGHISGCTALDIYAVVEYVSTARAVYAHEDKAARDAGERYCDKYILFADEIYRLSPADLTEVLLIIKAAIDKCPEDKSGHKERGEHRKDYTKCQCLREAYDGTRALDHQHDRRYERRDIAVDYRRERPLKARLDCGGHCLADAYLLLDLSEYDDIGIDRHAYGEYDTRDTGQRQGDIFVKCRQQQYLQRHIEYQRHDSRQTRQSEYNDHQHRQYGKSDGSRLECRCKRLLSELGSDDIAAQLLQLQLERADTYRGREIFRLLIGCQSADLALSASDSLLNHRR